MPDFIPPMNATLATSPFNDPDWLFEVKWDGYRVEAVVRDGTARSGRGAARTPAHTSRRSPATRLDRRPARRSSTARSWRSTSRAGRGSACSRTDGHPHLARAGASGNGRSRRRSCTRSSTCSTSTGDRCSTSRSRSASAFCRTACDRIPSCATPATWRATARLLRRGARAGARGHRRQAAPLAVRARPPQQVVAEAQGPARAGGRRRRLAARTGEPRRPRLADPWRAHGRPLGPRRPGRQRPRRANAPRAPGTHARDRASGLGARSGATAARSPLGRAGDRHPRRVRRVDRRRLAAPGGVQGNRAREGPANVRREREVPTARATAEAERASPPEPMPSPTPATDDRSPRSRRSRRRASGSSMDTTSGSRISRRCSSRRRDGETAGDEARPPPLPRRGRPDPRAVSRRPRAHRAALPERDRAEGLLAEGPAEPRARRGSSAGPITIARRVRRSTPSSIRPATLAWLAQEAAMELHPWTSPIDAPDRPSYALIDIDPGPDTTWEELLSLARLYRAALEHLGVVGHPKVTGKRGLQVWIGIARGTDLRGHAGLGRGTLASGRLDGARPRQLGVGKARAQGQGAARLHPERHQQDPRRAVQRAAGARRAGQHADHLGRARRSGAAAGPMDDPRARWIASARSAIRSPACSPTTRPCRRSADSILPWSR